MKAYILTTGVIFGLVAVAHFARMFAEPHYVKDPFYLLLTALAVGLAIWAWRLLRRAS